MTKLAPEWVRTSDPVIRSPARYRWTTAPAFVIMTAWVNYICSGYGSLIITTHQEQLISFIQSTGPGEHPLRATLKPRYITSQHTIHQVLEEIISQQRIAFKPRLYIHIITEHPNTNNVSPWWTAVTDNCVGLWFRSTASYPGWLCRTTPDYFELRWTTSGLLRLARLWFSVHVPRTSLCLGETTY